MTFRRDCTCDKVDCPQCGPLVALAQQIRTEFEHTARSAQVPTAEIVWWRAQMRARQEAAHKAVRPIVFAQALAFAAFIGLLVSVAGRLTLPVLTFVELSPLSVNLPVLYIVLASACCLLLAPLAVFFALARE